MNTTIAEIETIAADLEKGETITVRTTDGQLFEDVVFVSINSKGLSFKDGDKVVTRTLSKIAILERNVEADDETEDEATEGMTTVELAEMFEVSARALRVRLRKLGMGVGKGKRYNLTDADLAAVRKSVEGEPIED